MDEGTIYFRWGRKRMGMGTLGSYTLACRDLPTVNIISLIHKRAAAMQPLATSTISCWQPVWYHWKPKPQTETTLVANMVKQVAAAVQRPHRCCPLVNKVENIEVCTCVVGLHCCVGNSSAERIRLCGT